MADGELTLDGVKLDPNNANLGTDRGRAMVRQSLERFGPRRPVAVDRNGVTIAGNKTVEAAKELGLPIQHVVSDGTALVVVQFTDYDVERDPEAQEYAVVDNQSAAVGLAWHEEQIARMKAEGRDLAPWADPDSSLGRLWAKIKAPEQAPGSGGDEFDTTPPTEATVVRPGDLWALGDRHRLLCGDSTKPDDVTRLMAGARASLFATDPPYLVDYDGTNHPEAWFRDERPTKNKNHAEHYHDWDSAAQGEGLYDGFVSLAVEHAIMPDAAWYCWHASRKQAMLEEVWTRYGAFVHQQIIWVKDRPVLNRCWYMWQHEPCFFGWMRGNKPPRLAEDYPSTVWTLPTVTSATAVGHPTQKPLEVFAIPIRQHTRPGEICYEPFAGSGTQIIAAERLGRRCFAIEREPVYAEVILKRFAAESGREPELLERV